MSRYNKFGFYKNKFEVGSQTSYTNTYPKYPQLPNSTKFFEFIRNGYTRNSAPVANIDVVSGLVLGTGSISNIRNYSISNHAFLLPDGNVAFYSQAQNGNITISKYAAQTNTLSIATTKTGLGINYRCGTLSRDNKFRIYASEQSSLQTNRLLEIDTTTLVVTEKAVPFYQNSSKAINLYSPTQLDYTLWHKNLLAPKITNNQSNINAGYFFVHDLNANTITRTTLVHDGASRVGLPFADITNMVQHPTNGNVYIIPGDGFVRNGERAGGMNPNGYDPRVIVEYNPFLDTTRRFTPSGANLSINNPEYVGDSSAYTQSLFGTASLGVDGNIYCFPGVCRKDILAFNPIGNTSVQGTFSIFNTTGSNTITCFSSVTAPDGYIYARARGIQSTYFTGEQDFWLAIDTNPTSATYRQGTCIVIDPLGIETSLPNYTARVSSLVITGGSRIISQPNTNQFMSTLQIYGNGGYHVALHPSLNNNSSVVN